MSEENENLEVAENANGDNFDGNSGNSGIDGIDGIDGADVRPIGSGDGAIIGDGPGNGGDGGDGPGNGGDGPGNGGPVDRTILGNSSGTIGDPGSNIGDPGDARRKRGRPRKRIDGGSGGNHNPGRSAGSGRGETNGRDPVADPVREIKQGTPKEVKGSIFEISGKLPKGDLAELLGKVLQGLFFIPATSFGEEHSFWQLSDKEAKELAKAVLDCIETFPAKQKKKFDAFMKEYAPWLRLVVVSGAILYPRASMSLEIMREKKLASISNNRGGQWPSVIGNEPGPGSDPIRDAYNS